MSKTTVHFTTARANPKSPTDSKDWARFHEVQTKGEWVKMRDSHGWYSVPREKIAHINW